jgi:hypothetical protein
MGRVEFSNPRKGTIPVIDPGRTGSDDSSRMEVLVHFGREMTSTQTIWNDILSEIEGLQYLNLTQDTIWNTARARETDHPLTQVEVKRIQESQSKEVISKEVITKEDFDGCDRTE